MNQQQQAFHVFDTLKVGQSIVIKKFAVRDPNAFTWYAKEYIDNGGGLEFSNDYEIVRKVLTCSDIPVNPNVIGG